MFRNVIQEYEIYNDDVNCVPGKIKGITPSWRKRICGQINLENVVLRKPKLTEDFSELLVLKFLKIRLIFKDS